MSVSVPSTSRIQSKIPQLDYSSAQGLKRILQEVADAAVREAVEQARREAERLVRRA